MVIKNSLKKEKKSRFDVIDLLTKIAGLIFETENPLGHAYEIVKQTALSHEADVSTLFVVEDRARLVLKAGVAYLGGKEINLPKAHLYELDWNVTKQEDMKKKGLTPFIATSGKSLYVESYEELEDKSKYASHAGRWDKYIYPEGVKNEKTGFGCLYAVPLRRSMKGEPKESVIGVFKIERRKDRQKFNEEDRKVFDLVAAHLSLILQTFYRVQNRVFSDVAHAIGGGLGRSYIILTTCAEIINQKDKDINTAFKYINKHLPGAIEMLEKAGRRLNLVLEASRDPDLMIEESIKNLWKSIKAEVELKANVELDDSKVNVDINSPLTWDTKFRLRALEYHDLGSILGNLLDNAIRYAFKNRPIEITLNLEENQKNKVIVFQVTDHGPGISSKILKPVESTVYSEIYRIPGSGVVKGTGLRRVFGLTNLNNWKISYFIDKGTTFKLITPDFRQEIQ